MTFDEYLDYLADLFPGLNFIEFTFLFINDDITEIYLN